MLTHFHPAWVQADKSAEPKVQRLLRSAPIASRRRCPLKPWGPFGGNGRGPRRKYFRWGNLGGTRRRGLNNISMSEDGSPFQARGRSPGGEGGSHSHVRGRQLIFYLRTRRSLWVSLSPVTNSIFGACLNTMNTPSECYLSFRLTDSEGAAIKVRAVRRRVFLRARRSAGEWEGEAPCGRRI